MSCGATLLHRFVPLECRKIHDSWDSKSHECDGVYWSDGETERFQCAATTCYCGEKLRCDFDAPCKNYHAAESKQYGTIAWNEEKRPQPVVMFTGLQMGHMYGSREADSMMVAASTMQDAANRLEYLQRVSNL